MIVRSVLVLPNGTKEFRTEAEMEYTADDCIGECVGQTFRSAKAIGIDVTDDEVLSSHEVNLSFHMR